MELLDALKKPEMRKIFGKRELKIVEKQLNGVSLLPSEKTRLSRDIRKKFEAVRILSKFEDEFQLKKSTKIKSIIAKVKMRIMQHSLFPKVRKIILFGSTAENQRRLGSDIDLAIEFLNVEEKDMLKFRVNILSAFDDKIDIQIYNLLPEKIKKEIDKNGRIIFERKD